MKKLILKMNYSGKRWNDYLSEILGKELAGKCKIETNAAAKSHQARISIYDFKNNKEVINTLKKNENTISMYLVENNKVQKVFK